MTTRAHATSTADCPICANGPTGPNDIIATLDQVWVTAQPDAALPGYVCIVSRTHVREPFALPDGERAAFWRDVDRVAEAIEGELRPSKLNYEIHGNTIAHLHLHLFPRFPGDPFEGRPIDPRQTVHRTPAEIERLRAAIAGRQPAGKLVRDGVPSFIAALGQPVETRRLSSAEHIDALRAKVEEELAEYDAAIGPEQVAEELADMLEALYGLAEQRGIAPARLDEVREAKALARGRFRDGTWLASPPPAP